MQSIQTLIHCMYHPLCPLRGNVKRSQSIKWRRNFELFQESINVPNTGDQELNEEEEEIFSSDEEGEEETIERSAPLKYPETLSPRKTPTPLTPSDSTMSSPGRMPFTFNSYF